MTLNLVKGDFTELEDALRAQVQKLEEENNRLDEKIFLLDQENKLNVAERDEWRSKYEHTLANSVIVED